MRKVLFSTLALAAMLTVWAAPAAATSFAQCPAVGADTSGCQVLFTRNADGSFTTTIASPNQGPYDSSEDTLYGIANNGPGALSSVVLGGIANLYGFEGDGACSSFYLACTGGDPTGYGGFVSSTGVAVTSGAANNVFFTGINGALDSGTVNFTGGIPTGGSAWFSLEEAITSTGPPTVSGGGAVPVPEPATLSLVGMGLAAAWRSRRKLLRQA